MSQIPSSSLKILNTYRDVDYLLQSIPYLNVFRGAHRYIRGWAKHRGIFSDRFGFLDDWHIAIMLSRVHKRLCKEPTTPSIVAVVSLFVSYYAEFDFNAEMVFDEEFWTSCSPPYYRSNAEPMVIMTIHGPITNVASTASVDTLRILVDEFKRAAKLISDHAKAIPALVGDVQSTREAGTLSAGAAEFLREYESYIKIDIEFWGPSYGKGGKILESIEAKLPSFLAGT